MGDSLLKFESKMFCAGRDSWLWSHKYLRLSWTSVVRVWFWAGELHYVVSHKSASQGFFAELSPCAKMRVHCMTWSQTQILMSSLQEHCFLCEFFSTNFAYQMQARWPVWSRLTQRNFKSENCVQTRRPSSECMLTTQKCEGSRWWSDWMHMFPACFSDRILHVFSRIFIFVAQIKRVILHTVLSTMSSTRSANLSRSDVGKISAHWCFLAIVCPVEWTGSHIRVHAYWWASVCSCNSCLGFVVLSP